MKFEVRDPKLAKRLASAARNSNVANVVQRSAPPAPVQREDTPKDALTFRARSLADLHAIARYFGFEVPDRGRFPTKRLEEVVASNGHVLVVDYDKKVTTISAIYRVSLLELEGTEVTPRAGVVSGEQIRQFVGSVRTGQPSRQAVADAAIAVNDWGDTYISDSLNIEKLSD